MDRLDYMKRAIELAKKGGEDVFPNPQVGCVLVLKGEVVSEGYHRVFGGAHAEVEAFRDMKEGGSDGLEVYVTLEPCAHHGKTPPCAELIIKKRPRKVFVATLDPNPLVAGKGVRMIREAGIEVEVGIEEEAARSLNRRFNVFHEKKRPYVILKWAQTKDGFVAREDYSSKWISCEDSRDLVHEWRSHEDAIMVGSNTALHDNPRLNNRSGSGRDPLRVLVDWDLKVPADFNLYTGPQPTIVFNGVRDEKRGAIELVKLEKRETSIQEVLQNLYERGVHSLFVEGGSDTLKRFIQNDLWDEARVFKSKVTFDRGISAPIISEKSIESQTIGSDVLHLYRHK